MYRLVIGVEQHCSLGVMKDVRRVRLKKAPADFHDFNDVSSGTKERVWRNVYERSGREAA